MALSYSAWVILIPVCCVVRMSVKVSRSLADYPLGIFLLYYLFGCKDEPRVCLDGRCKPTFVICAEEEPTNNCVHSMRCHLAQQASCPTGFSNVITSGMF